MGLLSCPNVDISSLSLPFNSSSFVPPPPVLFILISTVDLVTSSKDWLSSIMEKATQAPRARSEKKRPLALGKVYDLVCERWDDGLEKMKLKRVKEELESAIGLEDASIPEYPGVKITSLSLEEVESSLGLEVDRSDFELLHVEPVKSPQLLGAELP